EGSAKVERNDAQRVKHQEEDEQHGEEAVAAAPSSGVPGIQERRSRMLPDTEPEQTGEEGEDADEDEYKASDGERNDADEGDRGDDAEPGEDLIQVFLELYRR